MSSSAIVHFSFFCRASSGTISCRFANYWTADSLSGVLQKTTSLSMFSIWRQERERFDLCVQRFHLRVWQHDEHCPMQLFLLTCQPFYSTSTSTRDANIERHHCTSDSIVCSDCASRFRESASPQERCGIFKKTAGSVTPWRKYASMMLRG